MKARNSPDVRAAMARLAAKLAALPPKPKPKAKPKAKAKAKAKAAPAAKPTNVVALVASRPALKIAPTALGRAGRRRSRLTDGSTRPTDSRPNPFALPVFPKGVGPAGGMAMDEVPALAWAATQAIYSGAFWEGQAFFGYTLLAELAQRPEYRRISERIATEATRKWIKLQVTTSGPPSKDGKGPMPSDAVDPDKVVKIKKIEDAMKRLKVQDRFRELAEQDGFFGRSHLYLDTGDGASPDELRTSIGDGRGELSKSKVNTSKPLIGIRTVEASWCSPSSYDSSDPLSPRWYKPESWYVMAREVHGTRLLTFVGREVPDLLKPAYAFGGLALTQMAKPYVDNWLRTRQSVSDLIASFSTMVLMTDLQSTLTGDGGGLYDRLDLFNLLRDNHGVMALNKDSEDFKNVTTPLGTLDMLQAQSQEQMSSVCGIPIVILLGIQPMGLNASSEGEIRVFYDLIAAYQNSFFADKLTRVIDFIQLSEFGEVDPEITFRFEPLWSLDEKAKAEVRKIEAETDKVLIDAGVLHPEESRERVAADPESPFASIDVEDVPEPPPDPMEAGGINPGGDLGGAGPGGGGQPQPKEAGAQDATVLPFGVADLLALDAFSEADHPRGQPGNAGQFGPGGSGGGQLHAPQYGLQHGKLTASHGSSPSPAKRGNIGEPLDPSKLKKISGAMGSNPGGVYEDDAGKKFYVKKGKSTAAKLYDLAGTPTLNYRPTPDGTHVATEMAKLDKDNAGKLSEEEKTEAARDFAVHAWLGNWDAVGLGGDNLGTVKGKPTALDLGGALEYRAQGAPKKTAFGGLWKGTGEVTMGQLATNIDHVLAKPTNAGTSYRQMLAFMLKKSEDFKFTDAVPKLKAKLGEAFKLAGDKAAKLAGENAANPDGIKYAVIAKKAFSEAAKLGHNVIGSQAAPAAAKPIEMPKVEAPKGKATAAELEKAKKSVALAVQYVPGFNELQFTPTKEKVNDLVNEFNKTWAGKDGLKPEQIEAKVQDFKTIAAKVAALKAVESTQATELAKKENAVKQAAAEKQAAANKAATESLKKAQAAAKAKNKEYMAELGISETEASGFDALVDMMSDSSSAQDLVQKFKSYQKQAEGLGYPISGFQYALIRNYINGGYKAINKALRANSPSVAQHVYARLVNNAIDKLPKYTGTVVRGTTLNAADLAVYKPGHVVQEHGFTSTGVGYKFGGNVSYKIKANGMRGGDFSTGANTGEAEVLFKAKTQFLVHKVEKKGDTTYIEMEEVEGHG